MLALVTIIGNAHATLCDHESTGIECTTPGDVTRVCSTTWDSYGYYLECHAHTPGSAGGNSASLTAVYDGVSGEYYVHGVATTGEDFCCDNTDTADEEWEWDGVYSKWWGEDDATYYDTIDLTDWTGDTYVYGYAGGDIIIGVDESGSVDEIHGGDGVDQIQGLAGADYLYGDDGADQLCGGAGSDHLYGGAGGDTLWGGTQFDFMDGNSAPFANWCEAAGTHDNYVVNCNGGPLVTSCPF